MIKDCDNPIFAKEVISQLEDAKLDTNAAEPNSCSGLTPFLCACMSRSMELVEYMLKHGANINSQTACQDGPLHIATFACANQNSKESFDVLAMLIKTGCDLNSKNWLGNTPLCIAASYDRKRLIRYLLFQGADPSICNKNGVYPIDFATNAGNTRIASLLAINLPNPYVWDFIEPHTPPRIKLGLQTPSKQHLVQSSFNRNKRKLNTFRTPRPIRTQRL
ncbi:ankyrin-3-like [Actinia tenebrosa]|uniref:Ankyrin-3-like n=1 Tax=Actinia tenebrosa TaxID=6105 RepID=A0A6P8ISY4_ACTTE|nr:ankyrin-3-like [Actinia tenebrosa]